MMIDEGKIRTNLLQEIAAFFSAEREWRREEVVYVMTLFRKSLEMSRHDRGSQYRQLTFFIDWCLHCELSRGRSLQFFRTLNTKLRQEFEESNVVRAKKGRGPLTEVEKRGLWVNELCKIIRLNHLFDDLNLFSKENAVELSTLNNAAQCKQFNKILVEVLIETPLLFKIQDCSIRSMFIQKNESALSSGTDLPEAVFTIEFDDGTTANVTMLDVALEVPSQRQPSEQSER